MLSAISQNQTMNHSMTANMSGIHVANEHLYDSFATNENVTMEQHQAGTTNATNRLSLTEMMMPKMENMMDVFKISCSTAVIFGGLLPYLPQYIKIKKSRSSDGFSTYGE